MTHVLNHLILNRREKPLEETHETGVGEGRELHTQESTSQELLAKSAGRDFSIQSAKVKTEHSASPSSGLESIKASVQSTGRLESCLRTGRVAGQ